MRTRAGGQHHAATRTGKPAVRKPAGSCCKSGRVRHQPRGECCRVANAWWNYIALTAKVSPDF